MSDTIDNDFHLRPGGRTKRDKPAREIAKAGGIGSPQGWVTRGGMRFRGRRAIVKVSVVKLRGRKTSGGGLVRGQLAYLQREEAGMTVVTDLEGTERTVPCHGQL